MKLDKEDLLDQCDPNTFLRGQRLFEQHAAQVIDQKQEDDELIVAGLVRGSQAMPYQVRLYLEKEGNQWTLENAFCTCPAFDRYYMLCKHCVALALYVDQMEKEPAKPAELRASSTTPGLKMLLSRYGAGTVNVPLGVKPGTVHIKPELRTEGRDRVELSCTIGTQRMYVVKNLPMLVQRVRTGASFAYGKALSFCHAPEMFDEQSRALLQVLGSIVERAWKNLSDYAYLSESNPAYRSVSLSEAELSALLTVYQGGFIRMDEREIQVTDAPPQMTLTLQKVHGGAVLQLSPEVLPFTSGPRAYVLAEDQICLLSPAFQREALPFLGTMAPDNWGRKQPVLLNEKDFRAFCRYLLPVISAHFQVKVQDLDLSAYRPLSPEFRFSLRTGDKGELLLKPTVLYGSAESLLFCPQEHADYRDAEKESPVREQIRRWFQTDNPAACAIESEDTMYDFLSNGLNELRQLGEVRVEASARGVRVRPSPRVAVGMGLSGGLIDLRVRVDELSVEDMERVLGAYREKKHYVRLRTGEFLSLDEGGLSVLRELQQELHLADQELLKTQVPAFRAQSLNRLLTEDSDIQVDRSADFKRLIRQLRSFEDSDYDVPPTLNATLRSYQKVGYRWLCTLVDCGLGGILADDMGLGKTIQAIALMLHVGGKALVVCPASLVYNWEKELQSFAPTLRVALVSGLAEERAKRIAEDADVYVTSYDLLRRDEARYAQQHYDVCFLDEAQFIRNDATKTAKAVKTIQAANRFALTGTPIANRLSDLWSIFDFVLPGYLYGAKQFRDELEKPITTGDEAASTRLQRMSGPFILRRQKKDVLRELPDKVESIRPVEMTTEQRQIYLAQETKIRLTLQSASDEAFRQQKLQYLAMLTRLRQFCCDPALCLEDYHGGSGKLDACIELLEEGAASGHKTLVFSQFTTMLERLKDAAEQRRLKALYLHGGSTKEERRDMVAAFQNGGYDVFFISLKAGGTGLNLTAADRVIHYDPWWNAAAEDQATDRAHRIGQKETVFVTKLVCKDTVEERILRLQEAKRALVDQVMTNESLSDGTLSREMLVELLEGHGA